MKYLLSILCLFIFSCDSDEDVTCLNESACNFEEDEECIFTENICEFCNNGDIINTDSDNDGINDEGYHCSELKVLEDFMKINNAFFNPPYSYSSILSLAPSIWVYNYANDVNPLNSYAPIEADGRIIQIDFNTAEIDSIPNSISDLPYLITLGLGDNNISSIPSTINELTNLKWIYLGENNFSSIPNELIEMSWLYQVYLQSNPISDIPVNLCDNAMFFESVYFPMFLVNDNLLCEEFSPILNHAYGNEYFIENFSCLFSLGGWIQDQSNCCEGPNGEPNWTTCP